MEFQLSFSNVRYNKTLTINSKRGIEIINFNASFYVLSNLFFFLCNKTIFVNLLKRKLKNIAFFPFLYYNITCKKNLPFKNFFYIITPYLIIYTPLGGLGSSPIKTFFFCSFLFFLSFLCRFSLPFPAFYQADIHSLLCRLPNQLKFFLQIR